MARRETEKGPGKPKIRITRWADGDFSSHLEVTLGPGGSIGAVDRPIATTAEITSQPLASGLLWTAPTGAKLAFGLGTSASASALVVGDENTYLVSADLVYAWTDRIRFQTVDVPALALAGSVGSARW